jgi:hypothetical protein
MRRKYVLARVKLDHLVEDFSISLRVSSRAPRTLSNFIVFSEAKPSPGEALVAAKLGTCQDPGRYFLKAQKGLGFVGEPD